MEDLILLTRQYSPKIYRFNVIPIKVLVALFCRNWQADPKSHKENARDPEGPTHRDKEQSWRTHIPDFKIHCKATVIKTEWYRPRGRQINEIELRESRNKPSHLQSVDFQQGCQDQSMGQRIAFNKWYSGN